MMGASGGISLLGCSSFSLGPFDGTTGRWSSPKICSLDDKTVALRLPYRDDWDANWDFGVPVVPVGRFMAVVFRHVKVVHLPRALVIREVSPLDQVVHVAVFVKAKHTHTHRKGTFLLC